MPQLSHPTFEVSSGDLIAQEAVDLLSKITKLTLANALVILKEMNRRLSTNQAKAKAAKGEGLSKESNCKD